jgi:hypothetical protein
MVWNTHLRNKLNYGAFTELFYSTFTKIHDDHLHLNKIHKTRKTRMTRKTRTTRKLINFN